MQPAVSVHCFAVMSYLQSQDKLDLLFACALILLAFVFDVFDGRVARWRQKTSSLGRELDSLADVISFGVAPAIIAYGAGMDGLWGSRDSDLLRRVRCEQTCPLQHHRRDPGARQRQGKVFRGYADPQLTVARHRHRHRRRERCDQQPSLVWNDPHRSLAAPPARVDVRGFRLVNDQQDIAHSETVRSLPPRFNFGGMLLARLRRLTPAGQDRSV